MDSKTWKTLYNLWISWLRKCKSIPWYPMVQKSVNLFHWITPLFGNPCSWIYIMVHATPCNWIKPKRLPLLLSVSIIVSRFSLILQIRFNLCLILLSIKCSEETTSNYIYGLFDVLKTKTVLGILSNTNSTKCWITMESHAMIQWIIQLTNVLKMKQSK